MRLVLVGSGNREWIWGAISLIGVHGCAQLLGDDFTVSAGGGGGVTSSGPSGGAGGSQASSSTSSSGGAGGATVCTTEPAACGPSCIDCTQANATAACNGMGCANICVGTTFPVATCPGPGSGMPACGSWDFETASSEGWALYDEAYHTASNGPIAPTNQLAVLNAQSLAIPFKTTGPNGGDVAVKVRLCNGGQAVDLSNSVIFARVHTAPTTTCYPTGAGEGFVEFYNGSTLLYAGADFTVNCDSGWYSFQAPVGYPAVTEIGFVLRVFSQWEGTYYLDDIRIE